MIAKTEPNEEETHMKIGFIGAGLIGGGLARLAIQAGYDSTPPHSHSIVPGGLLVTS
jgi:hypothetical protein